MVRSLEIDAHRIAFADPLNGQWFPHFDHFSSPTPCSIKRFSLINVNICFSFFELPNVWKQCSV